MVENDPRLRRPFMVAVANPIKIKNAHLGEARELAAFLRSDATQGWIADFGKGKYDDRPLFFPVTVHADDQVTASSQPSPSLLSVSGNVPHPLFLDADAWKQFPRHEVHVKARDGTPTTRF
jgi:hypothetical protein